MVTGKPVICSKFVSHMEIASCNNPSLSLIFIQQIMNVGKETG